MSLNACPENLKEPPEERVLEDHRESQLTNIIQGAANQSCPFGERSNHAYLQGAYLQGTRIC